MRMTMSNNDIHMVMFPFLAFGHISPFIHLSSKLTAVDPTLRITFLTTPANIPRISSLLPSTAGTRISIHSLPLPPVPGLPRGAESTADLTMAQAELLKTAVDAMKPDVESLLSRLNPHLIVFDFAMPWIPTIAAPLGIKSLFFTVFSAIANAYLMVPSRTPCLHHHDPKLLLMTPPPGFPLTSAISAAGGVPSYQAQDFSYIFKTFPDHGDKQGCVYQRFVACMTGCTAILSKTCREMEGQYMEYMEREYKKPMLVAGPVVPEPPPSPTVVEERWGGEWLDRFEEGSVIYCSFGSETFLKKEGIAELLLGLEMTGLPFLVVLNAPELIDGDDESSCRKKKQQLLLPEGFEERLMVLKDDEEERYSRGVVHWGWVPQQQILRHPSVGCYVNHGGFSSIVEGLVAGCRLVMMPQRGDQYLNSALFARDLGIGVEIHRDETTGDFDSKAVYEAVNKVMEEEYFTESRKKWKEFLMDKGMEERFMVELVGSLKALLN